MKIEKLNKSFGQKAIFKDFSCEFKDGCVNYLMGESGIGKTTLIRLICGLDKDYSGDIEKPDRISYVFQEPRLFPALTTIENIEIVEQGTKKSAEKILKMLELSDAKNLYPSELSGGMKMRLSLARAIYYNGDLFIMDEPFSSLDTDMKERIIPKILKEIQGKTIIIISHDINEAQKYADNIITL